MRKLISLPEEKIMEHLRWGVRRWKGSPGEVYRTEVDKGIVQFLTPLCEHQEELRSYVEVYERMKLESK